jgi:FkbM family methyltransferase
MVNDHEPYEKDVLHLGVAITKPRSHIVDVGANIGNHSVYWALAGRTVSAFEPNPPAAKLLLANLERNGVASSVDVHQVGLGREAAQGTPRQVLPGNLGSVTLDIGSGNLRIVPLDSMDLPRFELLKIDVEGHEADVIEGSIVTIRRHRPFIIAEGRAGSGETDELLAGLGYHRMPISFATTPTYLYAPSSIAAMKAILTTSAGLIAGRRSAGRVARRLKRNFGLKS